MTPFDRSEAAKRAVRLAWKVGSFAALAAVDKRFAAKGLVATLAWAAAKRRIRRRGLGW